MLTAEWFFRLVVRQDVLVDVCGRSAPTNIHQIHSDRPRNLYPVKLNFSEGSAIRTLSHAGVEDIAGTAAGRPEVI